MKTFLKFTMKFFILLIALCASCICGIYINKKMLQSQIAVADLSYIVSQSDKLTTIRKENEKKLIELSNWLDDVEQEIQDEKDFEKQKKLAVQYKKIAQEKQNIVKNEYANKIKEVEKEISDTIQKTAFELGCDIIFTKQVVINGGRDITLDVLKQLNQLYK